VAGRVRRKRGKVLRASCPLLLVWWKHRQQKMVRAVGMEQKGGAGVTAARRTVSCERVVRYPHLWGYRFGGRRRGSDWSWGFGLPYMRINDRVTKGSPLGDFWVTSPLFSQKRAPAWVPIGWLLQYLRSCIRLTLICIIYEMFLRSLHPLCSAQKRRSCKFTEARNESAGSDSKLVRLTIR
jgi:hypothetical protein